MVSGRPRRRGEGDAGGGSVGESLEVEAFAGGEACWPPVRAWSLEVMR